MKLFRMIVLLLLLGCHQDEENSYLEKNVILQGVAIKDKFWQNRININESKTLPKVLTRFDNNNYKKNFTAAAKITDNTHDGLPWSDSEVYKVIEGIAINSHHSDNENLKIRADSLIGLIKAAQDTNGYLHTFHMTPQSQSAWARKKPENRWTDIEKMHELYCAGHLLEAAIAYHKSLNDDKLLDVAIKLADHILDVFGPGKLVIPPGHQEIEIGLIELYRLTNFEKYLAGAQFFLDLRGNSNERELFVRVDSKTGEKDIYYSQDHLPVHHQHEAKGHAVRAMYMYIAMARLQYENPSLNYMNVLEGAWEDIINGKMSITGGIASLKKNEAIAEAFELPNLHAYNETCSSIAFIVFNYEMFLLTSDPKYIDVLERVLYNGALAGISLDGEKFSYSNPLASNGQLKYNLGKTADRLDFDFVACCLSSLTRFIPSVHRYLYSKKSDTLYLNLFIDSEVTTKISNSTISISQKSELPWKGKVEIDVKVDNPINAVLKVRIPYWVKERPVPNTTTYQYLSKYTEEILYSIDDKSFNVSSKEDFIILDKEWANTTKIVIDFPLKVRKVVCSDSVKINQNKIALERGPFLYCLEDKDNNGNLDDYFIDTNKNIEIRKGEGIFKDFKLLEGSAHLSEKETSTFTAIPYFSWANRGTGNMQVWNKVK